MSTVSYQSENTVGDSVECYVAIICCIFHGNISRLVECLLVKSSNPVGVAGKTSRLALGPIRAPIFLRQVRTDSWDVLSSFVQQES